MDNKITPTEASGMLSVEKQKSNRIYRHVHIGPETISQVLSKEESAELVRLIIKLVDNGVNISIEYSDIDSKSGREFFDPVLEAKG